MIIRNFFQSRTVYENFGSTLKAPRLWLNSCLTIIMQLIFRHIFICILKLYKLTNQLFEKSAFLTNAIINVAPKKIPEYYKRCGIPRKILFSFVPFTNERLNQVYILRWKIKLLFYQMFGYFRKSGQQFYKYITPWNILKLLPPTWWILFNFSEIYFNRFYEFSFFAFWLIQIAKFTYIEDMVVSYPVNLD